MVPQGSFWWLSFTMLYKKLKDGWVSIMSGYIGIPVDRIRLEWYFLPFSSQGITCIAVFLRWRIVLEPVYADKPFVNITW